MKKCILVFLYSFLVFSCGKPHSRAIPPQGMDHPQPIETTEQSSKNTPKAKPVSPYQVGDQFNRSIISFSNSVDHLHTNYSPALKNIVRVGHATGIFLGLEGEQAIILTSKHTVPSQRICEHGLGLYFPVLSESKKFPCKKLLSTWSEIDSSLVLFGGFSSEEIDFLQRNLNSNLFSSLEDESSARDKNFLTAGFGRYDNPTQQLSLNADADCRWFSNNQPYTKQMDPDSLNPLPYKVWSIPSGCDISHGDSGSPLIQIESGKIYGVFWTGKMPKSHLVQSTQSLRSLLFSSFESLYKELNLVVPSSVIQEVIKNNLRGDSCHSWDCEKSSQIVQNALKLF